MSTHKHKIKYRYYVGEKNQQNRTASGWEELEITLQEKLRVGDRDWEQKVKRLISANTGIDADDVFQCRIDWLGKADSTQSTSSSVSAKPKLKLGKGLGNIADKMKSDIEAEEEAEEKAIQNKIKQVQSIEFSDSAEELRSQLEDLIALGNNIPSSELPVRKSTFLKLQMGLTRYKKIGDSAVANQLEEQIKKVKPKWWHSIGHLLNS